MILHKIQVTLSYTSPQEGSSTVEVLALDLTDALEKAKHAVSIELDCFCDEIEVASVSTEILS